MMISASTNSWSNLEFSPSLSDVVTRVWPWLSSHLRIPNSFSVVPSSSGTSLACSWPCIIWIQSYRPPKQRLFWDALAHTSYRTNRTFDCNFHKASVEPIHEGVSILGDQATTCSLEVAVSVRTPPSGALRCAGRAVLVAVSSEDVSLAARTIDRANTILKINMQN